MFRKKYLIVCILLLSILMGGCKSQTISKSSTDKPTETGTKSLVDKRNPIVTIEMEDGAKIKFEMYPIVAPNTVRNFISLVQKGYYNGVIFHRVIADFMIQGGDPKGTGTGGPGYSIKGEFSSNKFPNNLKHTKGIVSMARSKNAPNSAGSQFFIMVKDTPQLDGAYAAFGQVIEGREKVDSISKVQKDAEDKPIKEQKMKTVTVDTFGVKYEDVQK